MFTLTMKTTNAAFEEVYMTEEVARILREAADNVESGTDDNSGTLYDYNGNNVGMWTITPNDY